MTFMNKGENYLFLHVNHGKRREISATSSVQNVCTHLRIMLQKQSPIYNFD